jgi:hypothetical protein
VGFFEDYPWTENFILSMGPGCQVTLAVTCLLLKEACLSCGVSDTLWGNASVTEEMSYAMDERLGY